MSIRNLDNVTINNSNKIFNGYIYNIDYQPSFGTSESTLTVSLISEDGTYSIQNEDLSYLAPHLIRIGNNLSLTMYPVSFRKSESSSGKILEVKYVDTSIILDKKIVVLNGRQGSPSDNFNGSCYIAVGSELINEGQTINDILEVMYNFRELCNGIITNGIIIDSQSLTLINNVNVSYLVSYYGSLRNVLSNFCTDLGLGFFWENNQLHFIDLTTPLVLDTSAVDSLDKEAKTTEVSIEDTIGRVSDSFYGRAGSSTSDDTKIASFITARPITFKMIGYNNADIAVVKAAKWGKDFWFTYLFHFDENQDKQGVSFDALEHLGIEDKTRDDNEGNASEIKKRLPLNLDLNEFFVCNYSDKTLMESRWKWDSKMTTFAGRFHYRYMTFGESKFYSYYQYPMHWYPRNIQTAATMIGDFCTTPLQSLQSFLTGEIFVADDPNPYRDSRGFSNQGKSPDPTKIPDDNDLGIVLFDFGIQMWNFGNVTYDESGGVTIITDSGQPMTIQAIEQELATEHISDFLPIALKVDGNISQIAKSGPLSSKLHDDSVIYGRKTLGNTVSINPNCLSPEEIFLKRKVNVAYPAGPINTAKFQSYYRSETDRNGKTVNCNSNVGRNELNYRVIQNSDFQVLTGSTEAFSPALVQQAHVLFNQNLVFSKTEPTVSKAYDFPFLDFPNNYLPSIKNGLISLSIRQDEKGVKSSYKFGTRLMLIPKLEVIQRQIQNQRGTINYRVLGR